MKILQINVYGFKYAEALLEFIATEKPDLINFQEIGTGYLSKNLDLEVDFFEKIKADFGYQGFFAPRFAESRNGKTSYFGNGFLTNLEILDYGVFFDQKLPKFTTYSSEDGQIKIVEKDEKSKYAEVFDLPVNFVWAVLKSGDKIFRNITTHFSVSYNCTETKQMVDQAKQLVEFLENTKPIPTIFTGDLNIRKDSFAVSLISKKLELVNHNSTNTLNPSVHPAFLNSPSFAGLGIDHIFQNGFEVKNFSVPEVSISDHLPVICEVE
jgi:endonuclease/exonuclease/phosphatase family metal-dependent hydrolase